MFVDRTKWNPRRGQPRSNRGPIPHELHDATAITDSVAVGQCDCPATVALLAARSSGVGASCLQTCLPPLPPPGFKASA